MNPARRNRPLDVLRGCAILLVLGRHLPGEGKLFAPDGFAGLFRIWQWVGWSGVDLFFVLSGFLVSGLLFREYQAHGRIRPGRFFVRRGLRIYPAFYLMIAVSVAFTAPRPPLKRILGEVFFIQNYYDHMWLHTWTLAIEEHFYLFLGLTLFFLSRQKNKDPFRAVPFLWAVSAVACLYFRIDTPYDTAEVLTPTHKRADALLFGTFLCYLHCFHKPALESFTRRNRLILAAAAALFLVPAFTLNLGAEPFMTRFGLTLTYLAFGIVLLLSLFAVALPPEAGKLERALAFLGVRSYSVYLWHFPVEYLVQPLTRAIEGEKGLWWAVLFYLAGAVAAGWASYKWIERPALAWRDRRFPAAGKSAV